MRKIISFILIIAIAFGAYFSFGIEAQAFTDVPKDHWSYKYIQELYKEGKLSGYPDGTFKPSNSVTRAEYTVMLGKVGPLRSKDFKDVPKTHWAYDYIMHSNSEGYGDNTFRPNLYITREQAIVLLYKAMGSPKVTLDASNKFVDFSLCSKWAIEAMKWAVENNLVKGDDKGRIRPLDLINRAESATIIYRYDIVVEEAANAEDTTEPTTDTGIPPGGGDPGGGNPPGGGDPGGGNPPGGGDPPVITDDTAVLTLYTKDALGNVVKLSTTGFFTGADTVYPGFSKTQVIIVKNEGEANAIYSLFVAGDLTSNVYFKDDVAIEITKPSTGETIFPKTVVSLIGNNQLISDRTLAIGMSEEFLLKVFILDKDTDQNYLQGKTTNFNLIFRY